MNPMMRKQTLTPALSHPMGEGESFTGLLECCASVFAGRSFEKMKTADGCSLSRRTGEGQGEGFSSYSSL
jgi:hypothetical protein